MPTRPNSPDPSGANATANPFSGLESGLGFFQDWLKAAGSALPHLQGAAPTPGAMPAWSMPTLDPQELDKRIQDLRTVQFWLEQNARMIAITIQGLEVQKMTLSTLQGMNVSMDAVRDALRARGAPPPAPQPAAAPPAQAEATAAAPGDEAPPGDTDLINPMRWWDTLTQQFTHLAAQTAQTAQSMGDSLVQAQAKPAKQARQATSGRKASAAGQTTKRARSGTPSRKPAAPRSRSGSDAG